MQSDARLPAGGRIDRSKPISFHFNGRRLSGLNGDTLASALLANGIELTGRSFKYHRPRGIVGAGHEEPASLVELDGPDAAANQPITTVMLREGLSARSVNCFPSPSFDLMAVNQLFAGLIPAAFYYKTFMWPGWHLFEPFIRRAAWLARAPAAAPAGRYESRHAHCDVLVVGAGPAGLMAALAAARSGARVMLVDDGIEAGGSLLSSRSSIGGLAGMDWVASLTAELDAMANVVRLREASAWGYREHNLVLITERRPDVPGVIQRSWRVRARHVVIAAGAIERALVFENNDRPGVMLATAAQAYVNRYAVKPGRRAVVFTNNGSAYAAASDLAAAGIEVAAIVDARSAGAARSAAGERATVIAGHVVARVLGRGRVRGVEIRQRAGGASRRIDCDLVCMSGGFTPTVHLFSQSRGRLRYDEGLAAFVPAEALEQTCCAGAANGVFDLRSALEDGGRAGREAARASGHVHSGIEVPAADQEGAYTVEPLWFVEEERPGAKSFVDIQNDVTLADIRLAVREGFGAVEHVKRYTTAGMGIDQGKTGNMNVVGILADHAGVKPGEIGTTTFRAPWVPVEFGAIGGSREGSVVLPYRHTPMTPWHEARGAVMYEAGARWRRPGYYPRAGESFEQAVERECRAVRTGVGVYDGSPLGKFEIRGRNALDLLEMFYTNSFTSLRIGDGRYGLMMTDDGLIMDDGVTFRLGPGHYLMSTSTANADAVHARLEDFIQLERPDWQVAITPVTTQWCNATVCGPEARNVLVALGSDIDLSNEAFPFMTVRSGRVAGLPARVCRVSYTGELSFEINVACRHGQALWEAVMAAGAALGIEPVGSEANHVLRVEKGFISLGHEADATVDPHDLGMGWVVSLKKTDFIGRRAIEIRRSSGRKRRELVGLLMDDRDRRVTEGAPLTPGGRKERTEGLVTACVKSSAQGRIIALALLSDGRARIGEKAFVRQKDEVIAATVVEPCFYDPAGIRMRS